MKQHELHTLLKETVKRYISPEGRVLRVESKPIGMGMQAVELLRHHIVLQEEECERSISLVSKQATLTDRRVLSRLWTQSANVPYSVTDDLESESRRYLCIQDVDDKTDYHNLDIDSLRQKEMRALAYLHSANRGQAGQLAWLPRADIRHVENMLNERWKPAWKMAKANERFMEEFGEHVPWIEAVSSRIVKEMEIVIADEASRTLIHNDLNPGNVLVHDNRDVMFIDWEEARYGSLYLDAPLRCGSCTEAEPYRDMLASFGLEIPKPRFQELYSVASRYLGLRFMAWNLGAWSGDARAKEGLHHYIGMTMRGL